MNRRLLKRIGNAPGVPGFEDTAQNIAGGTDAAAIQQSRAGIIATTVGAPVRYMHTTVQLCHADDMDATVAMLVKFMETAHEFAAGWE